MKPKPHPYPHFKRGHPTASEEVLRRRCERHDALCIYIKDAIRDAIAAFDKRKGSVGDMPASHFEIKLALAQAIRDGVWYGGKGHGHGPIDADEMGKFLHLVRLTMHVPREEDGDNFLPVFHTEEDLFLLSGPTNLIPLRPLRGGR